MEIPADWCGPAAQARYSDVEAFPQSLSRLLLPTPHSATRPRLDRRFETHAIRPPIVGEFADRALTMVFAAKGLGPIPVSRIGRRIGA